MNGIAGQRAVFERILEQFASVLEIPEGERTTRDRDSAILRFELTFEVCWKLLQRMVREQGLESNGPRQALERAFSLGWIEDESLWFDLLKDRNFAVHVYDESKAEALFRRLPRYRDAFRALLGCLPGP